MDTSKISNLKISSVSLANAARDESNSEWRLGKRLNKLIEYCVDKRARGKLDILVISEGRPCMNFEGTKRLTIHKIVSMFSDALDMQPLYLGNNGANDLCFTKIILFDTKKLFVLETKGLWPCQDSANSQYPSGYQFCQSMFVAKFILNMKESFSGIEGSYIPDKGRIFNLVSVHSPYLKKGRDLYFKSLVETFRDEIPTLLIGDYNLIPDMGGYEHEDYLNKNFINYTHNIGNTFLSFPNDNNPETGKPWESSLDRVYANNNFANVFGADSVKTKVKPLNDPNGNRLSDHHELMAKIQY